MSYWDERPHLRRRVYGTPGPGGRAVRNFRRKARAYGAGQWQANGRESLAKQREMFRQMFGAFGTYSKHLGGI